MCQFVLNLISLYSLQNRSIPVVLRKKADVVECDRCICAILMCNFLPRVRRGELYDLQPSHTKHLFVNHCVTDDPRDCVFVAESREAIRWTTAKCAP